MRKTFLLLLGAAVMVALAGCSYTSKPKKQPKQEEDYRCSIEQVRVVG